MAGGFRLFECEEVLPTPKTRFATDRPKGSSAYVSGLRFYHFPHTGRRLDVLPYLTSVFRRAIL